MTEPKWWDFTASKKKGWTRERIIEILEPLADRFCVGDEVGTNTGYEHLQGRVVFKVGKAQETVEKLIPGAHWSGTHVRDFEYCKKEGNFYCSWEKGIARWSNVTLRMWQSAMLQRFMDQGERTVMCVIDPEGGQGKTTFAKFCVATHKAVYCPPMQDAQDFMAFAMANPSPAYIFDMPRTESAKQKVGMWSAIEQIKNGYLYDKRYQWRDMWIEPPKILVFTNEEPPVGALSYDRWDCWIVYQRDGLQRFEGVKL